MKQRLLLVLVFVSSNLVIIAANGMYASPLPAQARGFQNVVNGLVFPTSSQSFFEAGQQQLEQEIKHLEQGFKQQPSALLEIEPAVFQQQQNLQQQEQPPLDGGSVLQNHRENK
jgi:hypothetical protein